MNWKDKSLPAGERARILVSQMTLEEKISQMTYFASAIPRFGIPEYGWWNEALHGVARAGTATMFPQAIGMAASFDTELLGETAACIGKEAKIKHLCASQWEDRSSYKGLTMWSPNINIFRDPRWGRGHETYGEDPYLTSRMGVSFIQGLQGSDDAPLCDATAKHFAVHSGPENLRHTFNAEVSKKDLALTYLPAFETAVREGHVHAVMGAYNRVNGEAACASEELLVDTLRGKWGFDGYVVSDCGAIEDIYNTHKLVNDPAEAAALAVNRGCDLCCGWVFPHLMEAVERGLISEDAITQSVIRLMTARIRLGTLDEEPSVSREEYFTVDCEAHHELSRKMACESMVLLKNEGMLPLAPASVGTVAVIGPNADSRLALIGNYNGTPSETWTVLEGLRASLPDSRVLYAEGCSLQGGSPEKGWGEPDSYRLGEALEIASLSDTVIVVLGLNGEMESEQPEASANGVGDKNSLNLPEDQIMLVNALHTLKKKMILINMTGSSCVFPHEEDFGAILQAWYPGQMGGLAVADILLGRFSPEGRLPVTFYSSTDQLPPFEQYGMEGRTYRYFSGECAYPFGFGLSYNSYEYQGLQVKKTDSGYAVSVQVTNHGNIPGRETVQAYVSWEDPASEMPLRQLCAIAKANPAPGESETVSLFIPERALYVCDDEGVFHPHHGNIHLYVGGTQPDPVSERKNGTCCLHTLIRSGS